MFLLFPSVLKFPSDFMGSACLMQELNSVRLSIPTATQLFWRFPEGLSESTNSSFSLFPQHSFADFEAAQATESLKSDD